MKKQVLFIDDDVEILESVRLFLESADYEVETDECGDTIKGLAGRKKKPDVILMDVLISGNDGRELTKRIKNNPKTKNIPVILLTAHPTAYKTPNAWLNDDFMEKPFDIYELIDKINRLT